MTASEHLKYVHRNLRQRTTDWRKLIQKPIYYLTSFGRVWIQTRRGMRNAAVFPLPVSATPMISRFCRPIGMACLWMGVGSCWHNDIHALRLFPNLPANYDKVIAEDCAIKNISIIIGMNEYNITKPQLWYNTLDVVETFTYLGSCAMWNYASELEIKPRIAVPGG